MSGHNFAHAPDDWPAARLNGSYAYGVPNHVPMNRGRVFLVPPFVSFRPNSELGRGAPGPPPTFEERTVINEPPSLAMYQEPQSVVPPYLLPENADRRPQVFVQESPPRFLSQWGPPPVQSEERPNLTTDEQQMALKKLKKAVHNPSPRRFTRRVSLYYRDHARNNIDLNKHDDEDTKRCAVCLEDFEPKEEVMLTPCDHMFHEECIVPWVKSHGKCPVCRLTFCEPAQLNPSSNNGNARTTLAGNDLLVGEITSIVRAMEQVAFQWSRLNH